MGQSLNILHGRPDEAAIDHGELPAGPLDELLGLRTLEVEEGRVVVGLMPSHAHCSATDADTFLHYCDGQVVGRTGEIATVEGRVWADPGHRLMAHGKVTCLIHHQ